MGEDVHDTNEPRHLRWGHESREDDLLPDAQFLSTMFQPGAQGPIAHKKQPYLRTTFNECWRHLQQVVVPLQLKKPGDLADDNVVRRKAEAGAELEVIGCGEKGFQYEATEHFGVSLRLPDAGRQVLLLHGIGYDDEVRGNSRRVSFSEAEEPIGQRSLEPTE
jgi:hypothetical protein